MELVRSPHLQLRIRPQQAMLTFFQIEVEEGSQPYLGRRARWLGA